MLEFFYNLIIYPIVVMYNIIFNFITNVVLAENDYILNYITDNKYIVSIILLSIFVNILTYNMYKKAEELQDITRKKKESMMKWENHIKKNFKGDEKYFILTAYYKERNYKPIDQFIESLSLLIQIPFFAAAYIFFSKEINLTISQLDIVLSNEDALLSIGDMNLNILPIIMTIINIISSIIYTKGLTIKDKIQAFILPMVFLIILYHSPSGLCLYWTINNIISLIKIIYLKNRKKKEKIKVDNTEFNNIYKWTIIAIMIFIGIVIPSLVVSSSPTDFLGSNYNQYTFIISTFVVFFGAGLWTSVIYYFSDHKKAFVIILFSVMLYMLVNHILYFNNLGIITIELQYEAYEYNYELKDVLINMIYFLLILIITIILSKKVNILSLLSKAFCFSLIVLSLFNIASIQNVIIKKSIEAKKNKENQNIENIIKSDGSTAVASISKNGKNIIMICLDRFIARYYPYAVEVMPKIKKQFEGFTVYKNTISFGPRTIVAAPAMYGGYEYVAYEMNKREGLVKEKMAEAYSIMPKMLANEGYNVAVSYIPYEEYTDLNYATYSNIKKVQIHPKSEIIDNNIRETKNRIKRNFVYYSIMKVFPLGLKNFIYEEGNYIYNPNVKEYKNSYSSLFLNHFVILNKLNNLFNVIDDNSNNAFIMHNETTHEPCILPMPDFYPSNEMGNERLEDMGLVVDGLKFDGNYKQLNVIIASLMQVGNFLDYLRENCVYDNTRIIIVGDHGSAYNSWDKVSAIEEINENNYNNEYGSYNKIASCYPQFYNPILMYKDFDSKIYDESNEFMTNADTPYLLLNGISKTMENPYTGNKITMDYKYDNNEYHITHREWDGHEKNLIEDNTIIDSNVGYWIAFTGNDVYKEGAFSIDYDMENKLCVDGLEHKLIYREASLEKKCGPYYIKNFYECEVCHKMYSDIRMENRIRDKEEYVINVPHEYKNYISDNNDSDKTHGTKTAHCIYNCGSTDTIYDNDLSMHHKYVQKIKKATLEEDGLITSECELCHVINIDENKIIIPHIKSINIENEVEYTGKKVEPEVVIIDNEDNKVSKNNYDISYSHNENIGIGVAKIKFKNYYTNDDDENKEVEISRDFKIVPERVKIKKIEKDGRKISISIERGSGRINEVEVLINDKFSKTFKKNDKDEYSIRLNEINEDIKNIKIRVVRYDNVTGEALYSPWVEGEVE